MTEIFPNCRQLGRSARTTDRKNTKGWMAWKRRKGAYRQVSIGKEDLRFVNYSRQWVRRIDCAGRRLVVLRSERFFHLWTNLKIVVRKALDSWSLCDFDRKKWLRNWTFSKGVIWSGYWGQTCSPLRERLENTLFRFNSSTSNSSDSFLLAEKAHGSQSHCAEGKKLKRGSEDQFEQFMSSQILWTLANY
jgi:hypothetical protein